MIPVREKCSSFLARKDDVHTLHYCFTLDLKNTKSKEFAVAVSHSLWFVIERWKSVATHHCVNLTLYFMLHCWVIQHVNDIHCESCSQCSCCRN
jgi:hypothetical protein